MTIMMTDPPPGTDLVRAPASRPVLPQLIAVPVDLALGAAVLVAGPLQRVAGDVASWLRPPVGVLLRAAAHPPLVPRRLAPAALATQLQERGRKVRRAAGEEVVTAAGLTADVVVPAGVGLVLGRVELTELVLDRVDLQRLVMAALDQIDLTALVLARVDLGAVVTAALAQIDLTTIVVVDVDLARVVTAAIAGLDLTRIVVEDVDLARVVTVALDAVDLTEIVRTRVDLTLLADEVIDDVNLPEIIRESTTGVASEAVQGARIGAIGADEKVSRFVDRVLLRRRARDTDAPGPAPVLAHPPGQREGER